MVFDFTKKSNDINSEIKMFSQSVRIVPIYTYTLISENLYREVYENDTTFESVVILENIKIKSAGVDSHHPTNSFLNFI